MAFRSQIAAAFGSLLVAAAAAQQVAPASAGAGVSNAPPTAPPSFATLVERLRPAVVNVSVLQRVNGDGPQDGSPFAEMLRQLGHRGAPERPRDRDAQSLGSGFIVSADGFLVTNDHVLSGGDEGTAAHARLQSVKVTLVDGTEYVAHVVGRDATADLAVLKIDAARPLPFVRFGGTTGTRVGDWVVAIGNPFALGGTVTAGIVSAIHRSIGKPGPYDRYIQTDAAINSGNSGGPLFDMSGNVVGINNIIMSAGSGGSVGIGFAIPADEAKPVVEVLMKGGQVRRGYLGIAAQPMSDDVAAALSLPAHKGELVANVLPGSPAATAGVRAGDVVLAVDGHTVDEDDTLSHLAANLAPGTHASLQVDRNGRVSTLGVTVGSRPPETASSRTDDRGDGGGDGDGDGASSSSAAAPGVRALGARFQTLTPAIAAKMPSGADPHGALVSAVDLDGPMAEAGVEPGDVVSSVNRLATPDGPAVVSAIEAARRAKRPAVVLLVRRGERLPAFVTVKLPQG